MKIVTKKIGDLIEAEYNPRQLTKEQFQQITDSIKRFGIVDPIIVNKNKERKNIIVGGHQRVKVAGSLGFKEIPCVEVDLTPEKERELNVRLNKNTGGWDWDALGNHFDISDLEEWGFSDFELNFANADEIDYSILDEEDMDGLLDEMQDGVKKAICIEFDLDQYEEAQELIKFWREQDAQIGAMLIEKLKHERKNIVL